MLKKKNEARVTTEWLKQWKKTPNVWFYKIPDDSIGKKPFDVVGCICGKATAIEFKYCKTKKLPDEKRAFKKLEPHQVVNLNNFKVANGDSFVIVYHEGTKQYILFDRNTICDKVGNEVDKFYIMLNNNVGRTAGGENGDRK